MEELKRTTEEELQVYKDAYKHLVCQLASPPPGWFTLGTHIDPETGKCLGVELEFWGIDDGGLPIWERPI